MSSVHRKLMAARMALQKVQLKKSGKNKFAGFEYFELGDFLPQIQDIFFNVGLCGVVSFDTEIATLTITDVDDGTSIVLTSPMAEANLKGVHPIQNMGAVETYSRRYLWISAMEIVEHDALDSVTGSANGAPAPAPKPAPRAEKPVESTADQTLFVDGLIELGKASTSLTDLSSLWKQNQAQIDGVKKGNPALFQKLQNEFAIIKAKFSQE